MGAPNMQWHMIARGTVQGVGFRAAVYRIAVDLSLTGTVENLDDGSVEIYIQGPQDKLLLFSDRLHAKFHAYIKEIETHSQPIQQSMTDFLVIS